VERDFIRKALKDERLLNQPKKLFHILDRMIKEGDYIQDYRKRDQGLEYLEGIKKILIIPSGEPDTVSRVLDTILEKYPDSSRFLITGQFPPKYRSILPPEKIRPLIEKERFSVDTIEYREDGGPRLFHIEWEFIHRLRQRRFDLAALIHEDKKGRGYIHVELLALLSGARQILIFKPDHSVVSSNLPSFIKTAIERKMGW
jgi:hypothetical protein